MHQAPNRDDVPLQPLTLDAMPAPRDDGRAPRWRWRLGAGVAIGGLSLVALWVLFVLPEKFGAPPSSSPVKVESLPAPPTVAATPAPPLLPEPPGAREQAQDGLAAVLPRLDRLREQRVESWDQARFEQVRGAVADGEKAYREQRYTGAIRAYEAAAGTLDAIEKDIPTVVADALDEGERGLLSSDPRAAEQAYALAASLDPGNAAAQRGLARAAAFDRVVALLAEARGYERMHDDERAATAYRAALALDADATEATQALQRIANARADAAYEAQMSKGYGALDNGDFVAARTAFEAAQKLRPHAKETINALAQTAARETAARIEHALAEAQRAEQAERWDEAGAKYRAALALDKGLETANAGAQRAAARAALVKRLATAIADPERLMDAGVYQDAEQLLAEARSIPAPGPRLAAQVNELHKRLVDARTSIPVTLVSDGATDVTIVRVGHLGSFTERALSLYPGRYTALGRRGGYRDARVEFTLAADTGAPPPITIQCQEQLPFGR